MPRFKVVEKRAYRWCYLVDAKSEADAEALNGTVIEEYGEESWADEILSITQVEDDAEL